MKYSFSLGAVLMALFFSSALYAHQEKASWGVIPMGTYAHFANARHYENGGGGGLGLNYFLTPHWAAELDALYMGSRQEKAPKKSVNAQFYVLDGFYYFRSDQDFQPFLSAGLGVTHFNRRSTDVPGTQFNINAGGGVMYYVDRAIALRLSVVNYLNTTGALRNDIGLNAGIVLVFGGDSKNKSSDLGEHEVSADTDVSTLLTPEEPAVSDTTQQDAKATAKKTPAQTSTSAKKASAAGNLYD
jgi:opacity protein-like surface antigen